jgi:hypothetical protein
LAFPKNQQWIQILEALRKGAADGTLLCPIPPEMITESMCLPLHERNKIFEIQQELSHGLAIGFFWELIAETALSLVNPTFGVSPIRVVKIREPSEAANAASKAKFLLEREKLEAWINSEFTESVDWMTLETATVIIASQWMKIFRSNLNKLRNGHPIGDEDFIVQEVCRTLISLGVSDKELSDMLAGIRDGDWFRIPVLACYIALEGSLWFDIMKSGRRYKGNDEWDRYRAACAYHCTDCFITDGAMAFMMRKLKYVNLEYFNVFSVTQESEILSYLKT